MQGRRDAAGALGIHGNGHMMMVEKNNREVLKPILAWLRIMSRT